MIGFLQGKIHDVLYPNFLVLNAHGIGYELLCPSSALELPKDQIITLYAHLQWRDDGPILYGFETLKERNVFRTLLKVSGVGGKTAVGIISEIGLSALFSSVMQQDVACLTQVSGIGKKSAERILLELKNQKIITEDAAEGENSAYQTLGEHAKGKHTLALQGLMSLGFGEKESRGMLRHADFHNQDVDKIIQDALKNA